MSFTAKLTPELLPVETGATVPLAVEITNKGEAREQFELSIEGLDPEWTALPVPLFNAEPGEAVSQHILIKPPRASESAASNYPFVVKARSLESGEAKSLQGVLQVKPYHHLSMELAPKRGAVSPLRRQEYFELTLMNLGNTEHTLQMFGSDPEDACSFSFDEDRVAIGPGQQKSMDVALSATRTRWFSGSRLHGFNISGRSLEFPSIVTNAQGQLEQRPLLSVASLFGLLIFAAIASLWALLIPKPPTFSLRVDQKRATVGQPFLVSWTSASATNVWITADGKPFVDGSPASGTKEFSPTHPGAVTIEGYSERGAKQSEKFRVEVPVDVPASAADPKIVEFRGPATAKVGQPFVLEYKLENVVKAYISPTQEQIDLNADQIQLTSNEPGVVTYTLIAQNASGSVTRSKPLRVKIADESKAAIVFFKPSTTNLTAPGRVTLYWQLTDAKSASLSYGDVNTILDLTQTQLDVQVDKTTEFVLTAYDERGKSVKETVKIKVAASPLPSDPGSTAPNTTTPDPAAPPKGAGQ